MLGTLIRKEIAETVLDFRFVVATVLCLGLIPLGMYVSRKDYERRLADYQQQHQTYRQHYGTPKAPVTGWEEAQGFRPPSILSIFASGLDPFVPDRVITSYQGLFRTTKETGIDNPQSLLFGKADWLFNIIFIMSLAALIFTYNTISGEKETGTLRLMIANAVPRSRILLSKILGKYAAILIPFVLSILITLFVLDTSPVISITSPQIWPAFLLILAATLLFLLDMVSLGVCISTFTQQSMGSIVLLFLVWTMFVLGVPKVCPILAEVIYPIPGDTSISFAKRMAQEDIERKYKEVKKQTIDSKWEAESNAMWQEAERRGKEIGARVQAAGREPTREDAKELNRFVNETNRALEAKYTPLVDHLVKECGTSVAAELNRIEQDYRNKRNTQLSIAMNLCRISPISCYAYLVSGLSGTGVTEPDNCLKNAQKFQDQMREVFYDKVSWGLGRQKYAEGYNPSKPPTFPDMVYHYPSLAEALHVHWPDMFLLALFSILFCALAFLRFNKYDVR